MRHFTADWAFTGQRLERGIAVALSDDGTRQFVPLADAPHAQRLEGILCPPFVNAHCHIELSHLHTLIPTHTGMTGFVSALMSIRAEFSAEAKAAAIAQAIDAMWQRGIGAVGDICNTQDTLAAKQAHSEMRFHTFAEVFGRNPSTVEAHLQFGLGLEQAFGPQAALSPHAPYSMSSALLAGIYAHASSHGRPITLHLLESEEERELFETEKGRLMDFLNQFYPFHPAPGVKRPQDHALKGAPTNPFLLVHCTEMRKEEASEILRDLADPYFVLCPGANEYINGKLPPAEMLARLAPDRVCLGTDSLASNTTLDLVEEMRLLQKGCGIHTEMLLRWACVNGRQALRTEELKGLVWLKGLEGENATFTQDTAASRIG
jgi:cytosine/adenosine deaminase-related metal-dependent hydrolase